MFWPVAFLHGEKIVLYCIVQWNLCNRTPEFSDILWYPTKLYGPKGFLVTKLNPSIPTSCTIRYISLALVCQIRQVPLWLYCSCIETFSLWRRKTFGRNILWELNEPWTFSGPKMVPNSLLFRVLFLCHGFILYLYILSIILLWEIPTKIE